MKDRIEKALKMAYCNVDGAHHKDWVIDQMVRALTGCPMVTEEAEDYTGVSYSYETQGESEEYLKWVYDYELDGYEWDTGTPP